MKKQLHKIKIAAENFSRSPKSDQTSAELQKADKQVERVKDVLDKVTKKFSPNAVALAPVQQTVEQDAAAREKRIKKVHEYRLAVAIEESLKDLPKSLLHDVLEKCAALERQIATEIVQNEIDVENDVTRRLMNVQENQLQAIQKLKRQVTKLQQDRDSAENKYNNGKLNESDSKKMQLKEDCGECEVKLENERDKWAAEMFEFIAEEETIAKNILNYVRFQQIYYKKALDEIERVMDEMNSILRQNKRKMFGVPLSEHLAMTNRSISYVIELCVCALLEKGIHEEGLLRVGCAKTKLRRMKSAFDASMMTTPLSESYQDVNVIACVLKAYLRDLPDPLLTFDLYGEFVAAAQRPNETRRKEAILNAIHKLPEDNYQNLKYLTKFLSVLASKADRNKMNSQNIAIVMSPNLLWAPNHGDQELAQEVSSTTSVNTIVESLVADWDYFFEGEVEFYVTLTRDEIFAETTNGGFPLDRDASSATIVDGPQMLMNRSVISNGQSSSGVSYMQPMPPMMTQSFMGMSSSTGHHSMVPHPLYDSVPLSTHSRSSSHDTSRILLGDGNPTVKHSQSNSSLSDHSSPPLMDSPKLPVRKKHNKSAAPTPPSQQQQPAQGSKIPQQDKDAVRTSLSDRLVESQGTGSTSKPEKPPRPAIPATQTGIECQTLNRLAYKTNKTSGGTAAAPTTTGPGRPVALPRTTLMKNEGSLSNSREGLKSSDDEEEGHSQQPQSLVVLREDRASLHEKPAIPERPASLMRSNFFKGSLQEVNNLPMVDAGASATGSSTSLYAVKKTQSFRDANGQQAQPQSLRAKDANNNNGQTKLERTHIFNVDKQQVAFIDVGTGEGPALRAAPIAEAESNAITTPTDPVSAAELMAMQPPPSPRNLVAGGAGDPKGGGVVIKRPQVPAPPPPTKCAADTEVTGL